MMEPLTLAPINTIELEASVTYCSSESEVHKANNTLLGDTFRIWQTAVAADVAVIEYQFSEPQFIKSIDIINAGSAFIEVLVGHSKWEASEYQVMVQLTTFMTSRDSKENVNRSKFIRFEDSKLSTQTSHRRWEKVRIICKQPFSQSNIGIANIKFYGKPEKKQQLLNQSTSGEPLFATPKKMNSSFSGIPKTPELDTSTDISMTDIETTPTKLVSEKTMLVNTPSKLNRQPSGTLSKSKSILTNILPGECIVVKKRPSEDDEELAINKKKIANKDKMDVDMTTPSTTLTKNNSKPILQEPVDSDTDKEDDILTIVEPKKEAKYITPFASILKGVVIVIGGIVNPQKKDLRVKALEMGADYKPDWCKGATHLITPYIGTPKADACDGSIVLPQWIDDCYKEKERLPIKSYSVTKKFPSKPSATSTKSDKNDKSKTKSISTSSKKKSKSKSKKKKSKSTDPDDPSDTEDEDDGLPNAYDLNDDFIDNDDVVDSADDENDSDTDEDENDPWTTVKNPEREKENTDDLLKDGLGFLTRQFGRDDSLIKNFANSTKKSHRHHKDNNHHHPYKKSSKPKSPEYMPKDEEVIDFDDNLLFNDGTQEISHEQIKHELEKIVSLTPKKDEKPVDEKEEFETDEDEDIKPEFFIPTNGKDKNEASKTDKASTTTTTKTTSPTTNTTSSTTSPPIPKDKEKKTDKIIVKGKEYIMDPLPTFFDGINFYLSLKDETIKHQVYRYIVAYKGIINTQPNTLTKFIITDKSWDRLFDIIRNKYPTVTFLKPSFIMKSHNYQKISPTEGHEISK